MGKDLHQIIAHIFELQIQFGVHRCGDSLPTIREASGYFMASVDTVRLAYQRLKQAGYITISTCVGATVKVRYNDGEIEEHIRSYFACRREALLSFSRSTGLLDSYALWYAVRHASAETLKELEMSGLRRDLPPVYRMSRQLQLLYTPLGNELLLRLFWQMFLFFQAPFVSTPEIRRTVGGSDSPLLGMIRSAREQDWEALWGAGEANAERNRTSLCRFLDEHIPTNTADRPIEFTWSIYKKASQICYSLCMELLMGVHEGVYPVGSFLPSPQRLAGEKGVGLNTVRRAIVLLNKLGALKTVNGVGTMVLPPLESCEHCDWTDSTIQKRLLDFLYSVHIIALSCRACAQSTVASMDAAARGQWLECMEEIRSSGVYENFLYTCSAFIARHAPIPLIRTVYRELTRQLFWGFPLRRLHGDRESTNGYYLPYMTALTGFLVRGNAEGFSAGLEELLTAETTRIARYLTDLGIREASGVVVPSRE